MEMQRHLNSMEGDLPTLEDKLNILDQIRGGVKIRDMCMVFKVSTSTLYEWLKEAELERFEKRWLLWKEKSQPAASKSTESGEEHAILNDLSVSSDEDKEEDENRHSERFSDLKSSNSEENANLIDRRRHDTSSESESESESSDSEDKGQLFHSLRIVHRISSRKARRQPWSTSSWVSRECIQQLETFLEAVEKGMTGARLVTFLEAVQKGMTGARLVTFLEAVVKEMTGARLACIKNQPSVLNFFAPSARNDTAKPNTSVVPQTENNNEKEEKPDIVDQHMWDGIVEPEVLNVLKMKDMKEDDDEKPDLVDQDVWDALVNDNKMAEKPDQGEQELSDELFNTTRRPLPCPKNPKKRKLDEQ